MSELGWLVALRIWNKDAPSWCVPRKNTEGYKAVQRIRKGEKIKTAKEIIAELEKKAEKPKVVKKTIRISLDKPAAEGGKLPTETNVAKETKKEMNLKTNSADAKEVKATEMEPKMSQLLYTDFKMGTETYFDICELQGENLGEVARRGQETDASNENLVPNKWVLSPVERKTVRKYEDGGYITKGGPKTAPKLIKAGPLSMINTPPNLTQALVAGLKKLGYKDDIKFFHGESKKTAFGELTPIEKRKSPTPDEKSKTLAEKEKKSKKEVDIIDAIAKDERVSKLADKLDDMKEKLFKGGMTREQATKLQADIDDTQKQLEKIRKKVKAELNRVNAPETKSADAKEVKATEMNQYQQNYAKRLEDDKVAQQLLAEKPYLRELLNGYMLMWIRASATSSKHYMARVKRLDNGDYSVETLITRPTVDTSYLMANEKIDTYVVKPTNIGAPGKLMSKSGTPLEKKLVEAQRIGESMRYINANQTPAKRETQEELRDRYIEETERLIRDYTNALPEKYRNMTQFSPEVRALPDDAMGQLVRATLPRLHEPRVLLERLKGDDWKTVVKEMRKRELAQKRK